MGNEKYDWCDGCKEYDAERKRCPRWNSLIKATLEDAKPKAGRWIDDEVTSTAKCSVCGEEWSWLDNDMERFIYCPNCGAKMEGEDNAID